MNDENMQNGYYDIFGDCLGLSNVLQHRDQRLIHAFLNEKNCIENKNSFPPSPIVSSSSQWHFDSPMEKYNSSPGSNSGRDSLQGDVKSTSQNQRNLSMNHLKPFTRSDMQRLFGREFTDQQGNNMKCRTINPALIPPAPAQVSPGYYGKEMPSQHLNNYTPPNLTTYGTPQNVSAMGSPSPSYSGVVAFGSKPPLQRTTGCSFCRNNKEVEDWYLSHQLKDSHGRVVCPVLRSYVCPLCCASGDNAHTVGHCPKNPDRKNSIPLAVRARTNAIGKRVVPGKFI